MVIADRWIFFEILAHTRCQNTAIDMVDRLALWALSSGLGNSDFTGGPRRHKMGQNCCGCIGLGLG